MNTILRKHDRSTADAPSSELAQTQRLDAHTRLKPHACRMRSERIRCIGLVTRIARGDCFDALLRASKVLSTKLNILNKLIILFITFYIIINYCYKRTCLFFPLYILFKRRDLFVVTLFRAVCIFTISFRDEAL